MKISRIIIRNFQQFKAFDLDLTDQKTTRPLEKVCFIGRNGTGKSTLLRMVYQLLTRFNDLFEPDIDEHQLLNVDEFPKRWVLFKFAFSDRVLWIANVLGRPCMVLNASFEQSDIFNYIVHGDILQLPGWYRVLTNFRCHPTEAEFEEYRIK